MFRAACRSAAILAFALSMGGARADEEESASVAPEDMRAVVHVARAHAGSLPLLIRALATVVPDSGANTRVVARIGGLVASVHVAEGELVSSGMVLAKLDPRPTDAALKQAEAAAKRAATELDAARDGGLDAAQAELDASAASLAATSVQLRKEAERLAALGKQGMSSEKAVSEAEAASLAAKDSAGIALAKAARFRKFDRDAEITRLEAARDGAAADLEAAQFDADGATIVSHGTGVVGRLLVQPGDRVDPGAAVAEFLPTTHARLALPVAPTDADRLHAGAALQPTGAEGVFHGHVLSVSPGVDAQSGLVLAFASIDETSATLRLGSVLPVSVESGQSAPGIIVPESALSFEDEQPLVAVVEGEHAKVLPVTVLARRGDEICVLGEGLADGAVVIVEGNENLPDGAGVVVEAGND